MDNYLRNLKAPTRSNQQQTKSFNEIQLFVHKQKRKERIGLISTYVSIAACILLLIFIGPFYPNTSTSASSKQIKTVDYLTLEPSLWYNLDRVVLPKDKVKYISELVNQADNGPVLTDEELSSYYRHLFYTVTFKDGTHTQYSFFLSEQQEDVYFMNQDTFTGTILSKEEYLSNESKLNPINNWQSQALRILILFTLFIFYMRCIKRLNPHLRTWLFYKPSFIKYCAKFISILFILAILKFTTIILMGYTHLLVAFVMISIVIFFRAAAENYRGDYERSWWEVPVSIVFYCICFYIAYL